MNSPFVQMNQYNYELIKRAIMFGAPSIADELIASFDGTMQNSNNWLQHQAAVERKRQEKEEAEKQAKILEAQEAKKIGATGTPK